MTNPVKSLKARCSPLTPKEQSSFGGPAHLALAGPYQPIQPSFNTQSAESISSIRLHGQTSLPQIGLRPAQPLRKVGFLRMENLAVPRDVLELRGSHNTCAQRSAALNAPCEDARVHAVPAIRGLG